MFTSKPMIYMILAILCGGIIVEIIYLWRKHFKKRGADEKKQIG